MSSQDEPQAGVVEMAWDPITRGIGSLGIYTKIDFGQRKVIECHSTSSIFRGYSVFMRGKDPRDVHFITSRICGICGYNRATCSVYAQNMACEVKPPLAEWIINLFAHRDMTDWGARCLSPPESWWTGNSSPPISCASIWG